MKKNLLSKILFFYSAIASFFVTVSAALTSKTLGPVIFVFLFLPVAAYFMIEFFKQLKGNSAKSTPILIYYNFIIVGLMVIFGFISAHSFAQLIVACLFFPLFIYFGLRVFPRRNRAIHLPGKAVVEAVPVKAGVLKEDEDIQELKKEGIDIDRRMFLKLIGSAGASVFLFSLFTKKAEAAFFGSVPGPGAVTIKDTTGAKIDPAVKHPTDGYKISRLDDSSPAYYGFTNKDGGWFVMKEDASGNYTYTVGTTDFGTNWTGRAGLSYGEYFEKF